MKTKFFKILSLLTVFGIMNFIPMASMAGIDEPPNNEEEICSPLTTIDVWVYLDDDCNAMQYCSFEILVFDLPTCGDDTPPIKIQDFSYDNNPAKITNVTINNSYVKVCVRLKPGTHCDETYYAPKCQCLQLSTSPMIFHLNICAP